jgi:hypothetical protein
VTYVTAHEKLNGGCIGCVAEMNRTLCRLLNSDNCNDVIWEMSDPQPSPKEFSRKDMKSAYKAGFEEGMRVSSEIDSGNIACGNKPFDMWLKERKEETK